MGLVAAHKKNNKLLEAQNLNIENKRFSRKRNVFLFEILHITPRRHIYLKQAVIWSSTSNVYVTIAALCNNMRPQVD